MSLSNGNNGMGPADIAAVVNGGFGGGWGWGGPLGMMGMMGGWGPKKIVKPCAGSWNS